MHAPRLDFIHAGSRSPKATLSTDSTRYNDASLLACAHFGVRDVLPAGSGRLAAGSREEERRLQM